MLGTSETPYDVRFRFLGIPVRIHPLFWLVTVAMGWQDHDVPSVAIWVACVFVSILVHEYGHGLVAKAFDASPSIVLWGLGGLCYSQGDRQSKGQRLAVILSGPGAGFLFLAFVVFATFLYTGVNPLDQTRLVASYFGLTERPHEIVFRLQSGFHLQSTTLAYRAYFYLVEINLLWGLVNLLPMWPLDGGQATQILLLQLDRSRGQRWTHIVSLLVAGILAVMAWSLTSPPDVYRTIFFGSFALINFQVLQTIHQAHTMGLYQEDEWWRR
jgi:stage IV sporulation protein FB